MIMKVRLEVLKNKKPEQYKLSKKYFDFLGKRTKLDDKMRYTPFLISNAHFIWLNQMKW
jgi:hypothetical protein